MTKALTVAQILAKNRMDPQTAWCELWEVEASATQTLYLANHPDRIVYQAHEYQSYPIGHDPIEEDAQGRLNRLIVHVPNVLREVEALMEFNDGLRGRRVRLILVNLDAPEIGDQRSSFLIQSSQATAEVASFVLGKAIPVAETRLPLRTITRPLFPGLVAS